MLACFAHKGWHAIGVDVNENNVEMIKRGRSPIQEPFVDEMIRSNRDRITATINCKQAVMASDVSFIIVPTPSVPDGSFNTKCVESALSQISKALKEKKKYHLVVVTSTVLPGDTERLKLLIEGESGKKCGQDFGLCYNPDFVALGKIVKDFLNPDMILIGQSDDKAGKILQDIHKSLISNGSEIFRMSFNNAELTKISINSFLSMKTSFANEIALTCENMPDGNAIDVLSAIGADTRIGKKYLKGGLASSGPCLPRDSRALTQSMSRFGVNFKLGRAVDITNDYHRSERVLELVKKYLKGSKNISILGLSYKEDTPVIDESVSISLIRLLLKEGGYNISVYDPMAMDSVKPIITGIRYAKSIEDCITDTSVCFIATPWSEFKQISKELFISKMKNPVIIDAWNILLFDKIDGIEKIGIGINVEKAVDNYYGQE